MFFVSLLKTNTENCLILFPLKDQQIDAKELQQCLTSSGISGNYHRKYMCIVTCSNITISALS